MSFNSGAYLGSHSTVSQWARSANAARLALLTWIGPLSKDEDDGLGRCAGFWTVEAIERVQVLDEVGASLGPYPSGVGRSAPCLLNVPVLGLHGVEDTVGSERFDRFDEIEAAM